MIKLQSLRDVEHEIPAVIGTYGQAQENAVVKSSNEPILLKVRNLRKTFVSNQAIGHGFSVAQKARSVTAVDDHHGF